MKVRDVFEIYDIEIPGFDITKTGVFMFFTILLLFLVTDNFVLNITEIVITNKNINDVNDLIWLSKFSFFIGLLTLLISLSAAISAVETLNKDIDEITRYHCIFRSKNLINISVILFFLIVSIWVIFLGGIMTSPFATLLSMSPILLSIQLFREKRFKIDKILIILANNQKRRITDHDKQKWRIYKRINKSLGFFPLILITITLILGYYDLSIIKCKIIEISKTTWFFRLYRITYYISVFIAIFGVLPREWTNRISKKLY